MAHTCSSLLIVGLAVASACGEASNQNSGGPQQAGSSIASNELARVDGQVISAQDVAQLARALQLEPREALQRLVDRELLIAEAARRGFDRHPEAARVAGQAAVQALLAQEVERVQVSDAEITEAYAQQRLRFEVPERRKSFHVLFRVKRSDSEDKSRSAQQLAQTALAELLAATEPRTVLERYRGLGTLAGLTVRAEELPFASRTDSYAAEYLDGLFSGADIGVVAKPVRTDFGWHAIVVTEIAAAETTPIEAARATLRAELTVTKRKQVLDRLLKALAETHPVERNEPAIEALLRGDHQVLGTSAP